MIDIIHKENRLEAIVEALTFISSSKEYLIKEWDEQSSPYLPIIDYLQLLLFIQKTRLEEVKK
ncbi:hypothetical protein Noda2021_06220 [Candidatus Dependentiae bacterium Noda2021]|nr:hypothetical protein Noda2021_06220 [Candidatus Dependentiae bacterium Noda2021]